MSEVISFRPNESNPREKQALAVFNKWCAEGYSVRHTITESLIKLNILEKNNAINVEEIISYLNQLQEYIDTLR